MPALLRVLMFVPMLVAARIRRVEARTIARLQDAGADRGERAILLETGGPIARFVHGRLERAGALRPAGNDRYYLYPAAYEQFRGRRRVRALIVLSALTAVIAALYWGGMLS